VILAKYPEDGNDDADADREFHGSHGFHSPGIIRSQPSGSRPSRRAVAVRMQAVPGEALLTIDVSDETSVQMSDTPPAGALQLVSLWQSGLASYRLTCFRNQARRCDKRVAVLATTAVVAMHVCVRRKAYVAAARGRSGSTMRRGCVSVPYRRRVSDR